MIEKPEKASRGESGGSGLRLARFGSRFSTAKGRGPDDHFRGCQGLSGDPKGFRTFWNEGGGGKWGSEGVRRGVLGGGVTAPHRAALVHNSL